MTTLGVLLLLAALGAVAWSSVRREREVDPDGALGAPRRPGGHAVVLGVLVVAAGAVAAARLLSVLV